MTRPAQDWRSFRRQALVLVSAVAGLLAVCVVASQQLNGSIDQLILDTARARLLANVAEEAFTTVQAAEAGQRGFLLTERSYYLDPYYNAVSRIEGVLGRLTGLAARTPVLQTEAAALADAARLKMAELAETIRLDEAGHHDQAMAIVLTDAGKAYMDTARASARRLADAAEAERSRRSRLLQERQSDMSLTLVTALCTGVLLLAVALLALLWGRTRLLQAQRAERIEAERFAAAVEHVRDGVAVFDAEGRLTLRNTRFAAAIGLPQEPAPGSPLAELTGAVALDPPLTTYAAPTRPSVTEARQGGRTLEVWRNAMPDGGQMVAIADITRRVQAEEMARQAQKMEVLGQMTGGIAHDFNNLLQVVSANLELAATRLEAAGVEPTVLERLAAAGDGVARGARLTRHLLAFARRQPLAPQTLDPGRLLTGMEDMLRRTMGEAIRLELVLGGGLWTMRADPVQMENAILNLALNARDAMVRAHGIPTGRLTIEVANASLDDSYAAARQEVAPGQYLMFAVTDDGVGMPPEQLARATEPFYTTKPDGKGTGLGLPMVFGFAKQSGGHFQLYSERGVGTTARLYLPRTTMPAAAPQPVGCKPGTGSGELVLLVEDDPAVRLAAVAAVQSLGYTVQQAENADEALVLLQAGCRPALLFTDVVMPGTLTSRALAVKAQDMVPGIAVLFTSGYTQNSIVHNGQLDPGVNLISKPWQTEELAAAMRAALDSSRRPKLLDRPRRVLLVEDEPLVRMIAADTLADLGFEVVEASSGKAALARLEPPPDVMVTDLGLPDMEGRALVAAIRARLPRLPVVIASGGAMSPDESTIWLSKPYASAALQAAVQKALDTAAA